MRAWVAVVLWLGMGDAAVAAGLPEMLTPVRSGQRSPADAAVVIGVANYRSLPLVPYAHRDADAAYQWLVSTRGVPVNRIARLKDPTFTRIAAALDDAADDVEDGGVLWVFFSGHGIASQTDGRHYLLGRDDKADSDGLRLDLIERQLADSEADHVLLVLDVGFAGVGRLGEPLDGPKRFVVPPPPLPESGRVNTWLGTAPREIAGGSDPLRQGVFTWHVLGALRGWADGVVEEPDGVVTLEEAQRWVADRMRALDWPQHPSVDTRPSTRTWEVAKAWRDEPDWTGAAFGTPPVDVLLQQVEASGPKEAELDPDWAAKDIRRQVQEQADEDWAQVYALALGGTPMGMDALRTFIARYAARTYLWDDQEIVVSARQVPLARQLLANGGKPLKEHVATVRIAPGRFVMGTPDGQAGRGLDETAHDVSITQPFLMSVTEIDQDLFTTVMGVSPSDVEGPRLPVSSVSWTGAVLFCNALSALEGLQPAYEVRGREVRRLDGTNGWRLPTEAEWTLAALRGAEGRAEDVCERANVRDERLGGADAWPCDDGSEGVAQVRDRSRDSAGLYGMIGNVAEWVWDAYAPFDMTPKTDPAPDKPRRTRVVKGGSYLSGQRDARIHARVGLPTGERRPDVGFRIVRDE